MAGFTDISDWSVDDVLAGKSVQSTISSPDGIYQRFKKLQDFASDFASEAICTDGTINITDDLSMGDNKIVNLADPTSDQHASNKSYALSKKDTLESTINSFFVNTESSDEVTHQFSAAYTWEDIRFSRTALQENLLILCEVRIDYYSATNTAILGFEPKSYDQPVINIAGIQSPIDAMTENVMNLQSRSVGRPILLLTDSNGYFKAWSRYSGTEIVISPIAAWRIGI